MNIMSDSEYREFCIRRDNEKLKSLKALPMKELEDLVFNASSFVEGQLEYGQFDYQDMYGPGGHVRDLEIKRQALSEKKAEEEMASEADDYDPEADIDAMTKSIDENV